MAITFKPSDNRSESWNKDKLFDKLDNLAKTDMQGRKVWLKKNLTTKDINIVEKVIWKLAKHSDILRKYILGVNVKSNFSLMQKIGTFISSETELKNDPKFVATYNNAIKQYNDFLDTIGNKNAKKHKLSKLEESGQPSPSKSVPGPTAPSAEQSFDEIKKSIGPQLIAHLKTQKDWGALANKRFAKIEQDLSNATSWEDFYARLQVVPPGDHRLAITHNTAHGDKLGRIKDFIQKKAHERQPAPSDGANVQVTLGISDEPQHGDLIGFKSHKEALMDYIRGQDDWGDLAREIHQKIERAFINASDLRDFYQKLAQGPNPINQDKIKKIEKFLKQANKNYPPNPMYRPDPVANQISKNWAYDSNETGHFFRYENLKSYADYKDAFEAAYPKGMRGKLTKVALYDIHDIQFQNLALNLPNPSDGSKASLQLERAKNYAIVTRDLAWDGSPCPSQEYSNEKSKLVYENYSSLVLYNWNQLNTLAHDKTPGTVNTQIYLAKTDTLSALKALTSRVKDTRKIAWVNMANAHKTGGGYQQGDTAQEESMVTNSDAIRILENVSEKASDHRMTYLPGFHIPPGGNYFHQTCVLTGTLHPIVCNSIVHAFADMRPNGFNNFAPGSKEYQERIKLDMRGVLRTAKLNKQEYLILSATGCGAFRHNPHAEAKAWNEVLKEPEFTGHFKEVIFAIKHDKRNPQNVQAFEGHFKERKIA